MNNTIQQIEATKKFEKILDLFEDIAPGNQKVQKQISLLTNSKQNYIKKLQNQWLSIQVPKFTELEIREINQMYFMDLDRINEREENFLELDKDRNSILKRGRI